MSLQKRMGEQGGNSRHKQPNFFGGRRKRLRPGGDELVFEPFAREGPTSVHGSFSAVEPRSDVRDRESLEDAHFDDRPELRIDAGEPVQESLDLRHPGRAVGLEIQILRSPTCST